MTCWCAFTVFLLPGLRLAHHPVIKKLQFHTPDKNGKSKCNVMHVGKVSDICPKLEVHGTVMQKITHDKYLGDIVSSNGKNDLNIQSRVNKGLGNVI